MKRRHLLSLIFYANLAIVLSILSYRVYLYATAPEASALLVHQIDRIEAADRNAPDGISFAVVGEANNSIGVFEKQIIPRINASDAAFVVSAGNLVSGGGEDKYRALLGTLSRLDRPYLLTFANNEYDEFGSGRFYQRFGPHFYSVTLSNLRLIFLDGTGRTPTDWQERWLADLLEDDSTRPVIVFLGHALIEPEPETIFGTDRGAWSAPEDRDRLLGLLRALEVDMVISAGAATYSDQTVDGLRHILTGGAGGFVLNDETSFYHYLTLTVSPQGEISVALERIDTAPTRLARRIEGLWFFIYSLFYVGIWNFLLIFSGFVIIGVLLFNRLFREREYYPNTRMGGPVDLGRPMRIAMFTNSYLPFLGGVPVSVSRLKAGLESQGHEVLIICPSYGRESPEPGVFRLPALFRSGTLVRIANPFRIAMWRAVREFDPDVIHLHHPFWLGSLGLRIAQRLDVPTVFTYHTRLEKYAHVVPLPGALFRNVVAHGIISRFANRCDQVIVPTPVARDYIRLIGVTSPVTVQPTGVEVERYRDVDRAKVDRLRETLNPDGRLLLISVSRLSKEKNIDFLIDAITDLKRRGAPPFRLLLLGEGEERGHLEDTIGRRGLGNEVTLVGAAPAEDVPAYLALADIFVFASVSETQGMVVLEAMAAGLPVVAVQSSPIEAFVENHETGLVTPEDVCVWTDALHALMVNRSDRHAMGAAARDAAQQYSVESFSADVHRIYEAALRGRMPTEAAAGEPRDLTV
ncbi:glycosyltransferase [Celeribacter indicus]|uniref:Group 1 glycosyl transferase n=1 Tax=Celeribacter indicus TaxID=1208324 RepID=A0A0B5DQR3_9RHOB|nr:glycosyltransferase [Celeribacter indicus]AJE45434.1 group 1 glycosyl transferase [Celeribacter indicus]SDX01883.1 Glycosyltransferase involved in cell wall bisynthesis [Celeribacter indicus]